MELENHDNDFNLLRINKMVFGWLLKQSLISTKYSLLFAMAL